MNDTTKLAAAVAAALLLSSGAAPAQVKNDLLSIYRDALANDSVFAAARFARQAAEERPAQARAGLLPNVTAGLGVTQTYYNSETPDLSSNYRSWGPTLTLTMPLYRPQNWDLLDQAKLAVTSAEATLAQARQDLMLRVTQAYFDVLAAEDNLAAIEANKRGASEQLAQARREFEVGTKTIVDTTEAQARYDQIVAQEQVARGDLIVKRSALRAIIGRDVGNLLPLADQPQLTPPQPADVEAWAKRAEENNPNVAAAAAGAQIAVIETRRNRNGHLPTLDLVASARQDRANGSATSSVDNTTRTGTVGLQLTIPIYSGGLVQSRVREALANEEKAKYDLETARRNAAQGARQAYAGVDYGLTQVRALESAEKSAQAQLDSTRLGYQVGVRINLDVLNAQSQLTGTRRDLKKARYDFLVNGLRLKSAAGDLTEKDLEAINALLAR
ncbi:MAG TPA: TolC family outer membrane protein [Burkholderiaceae bacterium]|jgi:outer membrane protein|nr:TolC family outer membrane protein [Burkholderiaceae bacterium]